MFHKLLFTLGALLASLLVAVGPTGPANAADVTINGVRYDCRDYTDRKDHVFSYGVPDGKNMMLQITVAYRRCNPYDPDRYTFYQANYVIGAYNREGGSMSCNEITRYWDGAKFNMYFYSPQRGSNYNPGEFTLGCSSDTTASEMQNYSYDTSDKLYEGPDLGSGAQQPRWRVTMTAARNGDTDATYQYGQEFNWRA